MLVNLLISVKKILVKYPNILFLIFLYVICFYIYLLKLGTIGVESATTVVEVNNIVESVVNLCPSTADAELLERHRLFEEYRLDTERVFRQMRNHPEPHIMFHDDIMRREALRIRLRNHW